MIHPSIPLEATRQLERLQKIFQQVMADYRLSRQESAEMLVIAQSNPMITAVAVTLWRQVQEKVWQGEIQIGK